MDRSTTTIDFVEKNNSIILGIVLILNFVVGAINDYLSISNLFPIGMLGLGILAIVNNVIYGKVGLRISVPIFIFTLLFLFQICISVVYVSSDITLFYVLCFFTIGLPSIYIATRKNNINYVRHTVILVAAFCFLHFFNILTLEYTVYTAAEQMGNAYSLLIIFFISIWTLLDTKDKFFWKILAGLECTMCLLILLKVMTRGAWVCIAVFLFFLVWKKTKKNFKLYLLLLPIVLLATVFFVVPYFVESNLYYNLFYMKSGDIMNGRNELYNMSTSSLNVLEVLFGAGIGSFYNKYQTYPHNIILQLFHDQGIVSLFVIMYICIKSLNGLVDGFFNSNQRDYLTILVVCAGIVKLMLSSYFWIEQLFWIAIGLLLSRRKTGGVIQHE